MIFLQLSTICVVNLTSCVSAKTHAIHCFGKPHLGWNVLSLQEIAYNAIKLALMVLEDPNGQN